MIWAWIMANATCVFAGIGAKWLIDRVFGREPVQVVLAGQQPGAPVRTPARRQLEFDDTMDVLGAGVDVGVKIGRRGVLGPGLSAAPDPDELAFHGNEVGPGVFADKGGWISGPCLDEPPANGQDAHPFLAAP